MPVGVRVGDVIDMKESLPIAHAPGVVAVLDSFPSPDPQGFVGKTVLIRTATGRVFPTPIAAVRDHGVTISVFFKELTIADVPVGSQIEFDD